MQTAIREEFTYLNRLRESGEVNMFGAAPYIERIIDGLDWGDLWQYAYDKLSEEMDEYTDEGLTEQVKDTYPDLLENQ